MFEQSEIFIFTLGLTEAWRSKKDGAVFPLAPGVSAGSFDPAEASRGEYGFLPPVQRQRSTIVKPGTMIVSQPMLPVPIVVEFPFPSWATRPAERGENPAEVGAFALPDDPLDGVPPGPRS